MYFGVEENLRRIISPKIYKKEVIKLIINIDGMPVYEKSSIQLWPILIKIFDKDYESFPFMVAAFCGKSKPFFMNEFLQDFVTEIVLLLERGLQIDDHLYIIQILGFSFDTPARSSVKYSKGHGGFQACERCIVEGVSVPNFTGKRSKFI